MDLVKSMMFCVKIYAGEENFKCGVQSFHNHIEKSCITAKEMYPMNFQKRTE
jgi:hypothetical protein